MPPEKTTAKEGTTKLKLKGKFNSVLKAKGSEPVRMGILVSSASENCSRQSLASRRSRLASTRPGPTREATTSVAKGSSWSAATRTASDCTPPSSGRSLPRRRTARGRGDDRQEDNIAEIVNQRPPHSRDAFEEFDGDEEKRVHFLNQWANDADDPKHFHFTTETAEEAEARTTRPKRLRELERRHSQLQYERLRRRGT